MSQGNYMSAATISDIKKPAAASGLRPVTELLVTGMTCGNCARHVTDAIQGVSGVRSADVSLDARTARVRWDSSEKQNVPAVVEAIRQAGYGAEVARGSSDQQRTPGKTGGWELNLWVGVLGTVPADDRRVDFNLGMSRWFQWSSFFVAGIVQVLAGGPFYRGAWAQLKARSSNMDTLVALGSTTAFAYSTWALFSGSAGHLYFMEAAAILTLISVGHWMEARVSH